MGRESSLRCWTVHGDTIDDPRPAEHAHLFARLVRVMPPDGCKNVSFLVDTDTPNLEDAALVQELSTVIFRKRRYFNCIIVALDAG